MKPDRQAGGRQRGQDFLSLPQGIAEQHGRCSSVEDALAPGNHRLDHLARVWEPVGGLAKSTFQNQHVGRHGLRRHARETGPRPQIAGIEDAAEVGLHQRLRRPENMAGRMEADDTAVEGDRLSVGDGLDGTGRWLASPVSDEAAGCRSRIGERMIRDVVTVGVADDRPRPRLPGIEPQLLLGKVNTALPEDGVRDHGWIRYSVVAVLRGQYQPRRVARTAGSASGALAATVEHALAEVKYGPLYG